MRRLAGGRRRVRAGDDRGYPAVLVLRRRRTQRAGRNSDANMTQPVAPIFHGAEQYGLRPEASEFPMMLVLSFVYACNALCAHCPYASSTIRKEYQDLPCMAEST